VGAVRTLVGRHGGSVCAMRPDDLGAIVLQALVEIRNRQIHVTDTGELERCAEEGR
jgi:acetyl-CoA acetyltransferase